MKHAAKLRPNFLYAITLMAGMICFLGVATDVGANTVSNMASALGGVVATVLTGLINRDDPDSDTSPAPFTDDDAGGDAE